MSSSIDYYAGSGSNQGTGSARTDQQSESERYRRLDNDDRDEYSNYQNDDDPYSRRYLDGGNHNGHQPPALVFPPPPPTSGPYYPAHRHNSDEQYAEHRHYYSGGGQNDGGGRSAVSDSNSSSGGIIDLYDRSPGSSAGGSNHRDYFQGPTSPSNINSHSTFDTNTFDGHHLHPNTSRRPSTSNHSVSSSSTSATQYSPSSTMSPATSFSRSSNSTNRPPGLPEKPSQYKHNTSDYADGFYSSTNTLPRRERSSTLKPALSPPPIPDYLHRARQPSSASTSSSYDRSFDPTPVARGFPPRTASTSSTSTSNLSYSSSTRSVSTITRNSAPGSSGHMEGVDENGLPEFLNPALLSNIAVFLKDTVRRGSNMKGAVEHPHSFTGRDIVSVIQLALPKIERLYAIDIARILQQSLWFQEVDYDTRVLRDTSERVYVFSDPMGAVDELSTIPTGVLTEVSGCYSSSCGRLDEDRVPYPCYAFSCPNNKEHRIRHHANLLYTPELGEDPEDWAASVAPSVVDSLPNAEVQRQSLMFELIQGEQNYLNDLELIESGFVEPLRSANPPIIAAGRLEAFLSQVLLNIADIREHSRAFLEALLSRQKAQYPRLAMIGDIVLRAAVDWSEDYTRFTINFPLAELKFKQEKKFNARFEEFVNQFTRLAAAKKQGFEHFQTRSTFRAVRYLLLLEQILKKTEDERDRGNLQQAIAVISAQSAEANEGIALTKNRISCHDYQTDLIHKPGDNFDLELLDESRMFYTSSKVYRKPDGSNFSEWNEAFLILFDHYLVVTKPQRLERNGRSKYAISRRPLPLELITLRPTSFSDRPVQRSSGFHLRGAFDNAPTSPNQDAGALAYPISFRQLGRHNGIVTYYVESQTIRNEWAKKLKQAISARMKFLESERVVRLEVISDSTFGATTIGSLEPSAPASSQFGKPTCSIPLSAADGQQLIAIGSPEGLFIGHRGRSKSMRQVLHLPDITQCAILQEFGFFLVVAGRILIAYPIEVLIPSGNVRDTLSKVPQKLSGQKDVLFFRIGKVGDPSNPRTLVIYVKRSGVKESVFKALEPVHPKSEKNGGGNRSGLFGFGGTKSESFKTYKDFFIPSSSYSIQFLRSKLAIICSKGVEIMNMENLRTMSVPDFSGHRNDPISVALAKRCEESKTLGMFRLQDRMQDNNEFLLCYDDFAFIVDKHGEPVVSRYSSIIDWESHPESVAYHRGHIFAFSPTIIEIRHAYTGKLIQVIHGSSIFMTYDGSVIDDANGGGGTLDNCSEKRIHFSMKVGGFHVVYEVVSLV